MKKIFLFVTCFFSLLVLFVFTNNVEAFEPIPYNETIMDVYKDENNLLCDVAVITKINSLEDLVDLKAASKKANTAILTIDKDMNLVDSENNSLNISLRNAYDEYLCGKVIPAVYLLSEEIADEFINYHSLSFNFIDMFVVSSDAKIVEKVRKAIPLIRGIVDYSNEAITEDKYSHIVSESNQSYANVVILNKEDATYDAIRYIQARYKTVWVLNDEFVKNDVVNQISIGAYGVICDDYNSVYETFEMFNDSKSLSLTRVPYNIAHRGVFFDEAENTLVGFQKAYEYGATHLELDIRMTKDGKLVLMHDATIDRCVYYQKGNVSDYTLAELEAMLVRQNGYLQILPEEKWAPVASLESIFSYFKGLDVVLLVEIKSEEANLVSVLKEMIEQYDIMDQIVVITSRVNQVEKMRDELPQVPTATLNSISTTNLASGLEKISSLNCVVDMHYGDVSNDKFDDFVFDLAVRGYGSWFWTYDYEKTVWDAIKNGVVGITSNSPDDISDYIVGFNYTKYAPVNLSSYNGEAELEVVSYDKTITKVLAQEVYSYEENGNKYAYFVYTATGYKNKTYQIFSGRMLLVDESEYVGLKEIQTILSKNANELTKEEIESLRKIESMYEKLDSVDKAKVDIEKANLLLAEIQNDAGGNNLITIIIVGSILLLAPITTIIIVKGQKNSKKRCK